MGEKEQDLLLNSLIRNTRRSGLNRADRELVGYVRRLTRNPRTVTRQDITRLRGAGFDDRAVHDICTIAAYFNFVNRIADGLGVELESHPSHPDGKTGT